MKSESLKLRYINAKTAWGEKTMRFDYKAANQLHDEAALLMNEIWALPDYGEATLVELSEHENEFVRLGASAALLSIDETKAISNLSALRDSSKIYDVSFNAKMIIQEWGIGGVLNFRNRKNIIHN